MNATDSKFRFVYMTTKDKTEASAIAEVLVNERLAACANILPGMESVYHWEGKVCRETEAVLIAKTTAGLVPSLIERVKQIHTYKTPCIVSLPILDSNTDYLQWIADETKTDPK